MDATVQETLPQLLTLKKAGQLADKSTDTIKRWGNSGKFQLVWFMNARHVDAKTFLEFLRGEPVA